MIKKIISIFIFVLIFLTIFTFFFFFRTYYIPSISMLPTIKPGDNLLVQKNYYLKNDINQGDIVVFKTKNDGDYVKRIIGMPGDTMWIKNGKLFINKKEIEQIYNGRFMYYEDKTKLSYDIYIERLNKDKMYKVLDQGSYEETDFTKAFIIPDNYFYALGDNRDGSHDSRFIGFISRSDILHKIYFIFWSSLDWSRIGINPNKSL